MTPIIMTAVIAINGAHFLLLLALLYANTSKASNAK